jgi:hypothetical protein
MCWSASVSLNTFLLCVFAVALSALNGLCGPIEAAFAATYMGMQLVEFLIWRDLAAGGAWNARLSAIGFGLILAQPLLSIAMLVERPDGAPAWALPVLLALYAAFLAAALALLRPRFQTVRAPNGHLAWLWLAPPAAFVLAYAVLLLAPMLLRSRWLTAAVVAGTMAASYALWRREGTWGSMWCWIAALFALAYIAAVFAADLCAGRAAA